MKYMLIGLMATFLIVGGIGYSVAAPQSAPQNKGATTDGLLTVQGEAQGSKGSSEFWRISEGIKSSSGEKGLTGDEVLLPRGSKGSKGKSGKGDGIKSSSGGKGLTGDEVGIPTFFDEADALR